MSESDNETTSNDMEKPDSNEQRRSTLADFRQNSFEARYRSIINKQILESSINSDELKRQLSNFIPFGKGFVDTTSIVDENEDENHEPLSMKLNDFVDVNDDDDNGCNVKKEIFNTDDFKEEDESENLDDNDDDDDITKKNE